MTVSDIEVSIIGRIKTYNSSDPPEDVTFIARSVHRESQLFLIRDGANEIQRKHMKEELLALQQRTGFKAVDVYVDDRGIIMWEWPHGKAGFVGLSDGTFFPYMVIARINDVYIGPSMRRGPPLADTDRDEDYQRSQMVELVSNYVILQPGKLPVGLMTHHHYNLIFWRHMKELGRIDFSRPRAFTFFDRHCDEADIDEQFIAGLTSGFGADFITAVINHFRVSHAHSGLQALGIASLSDSIIYRSVFDGGYHRYSWRQRSSVLGNVTSERYEFSDEDAATIEANNARGSLTDIDLDCMTNEQMLVLVKTNISASTRDGIFMCTSPYVGDIYIDQREALDCAAQLLKPLWSMSHEACGAKDSSSPAEKQDTDNDDGDKKKIPRRSFMRDILALGFSAFASWVLPNLKLNPGQGNAKVAVKDKMADIEPWPFPFSTSEFRKEDGRWWLYLNRRKTLPLFGIVYQPTEKGKHINDYKKKGGLYSSLLNIESGGKGDAKKISAMGISAIRVYDLPIEDSQDAQMVKRIFREVHQKYGIRFLVGHWGGLYSNIDFRNLEERKKVLNSVVKLVELYAQEPWLLGWQIGNENNYYIQGGSLGERINLTLKEYYGFMDQLAAAAKASQNNKIYKHIVVLGNGDLAGEEIEAIRQMRNIDALGINCFRDDAGTQELVRLAAEELALPIALSEFGMPAEDANQQLRQAEHLKNTVTRCMVGSLTAMAFVCEATDETWKEIDTGKRGEGHLGILGKRGEAVLGQTIELIRESWGRKYPLPTRELPDSSELVRIAWEALQLKAYRTAEEYAKKCIKAWEGLASKQQQVCKQRGLFPATEATELNTGIVPTVVRMPVCTREVFEYRVLNDVGLSYYILGRAYFEQNRPKEANKAFETMLEEYSYAQVAQDREPINWVVEQRYYNGDLIVTNFLIGTTEEQQKVRYLKLPDTIIKLKGRYMILQLPIASECLTFEAWRYLLVKDYEASEAYADKCINLYLAEARIQEEKSELGEVDEKADSWALNDVGSCYFIIIRALVEQGRLEAAKNVYNKLQNLKFAQLKDFEGNCYRVVYAAKKLYPQLLDFSVPRKKKCLYSLGTVFLIIAGSGILRIFKRLDRKDRQFKIKEESALDWKDRVVFMLLLFSESFSLLSLIIFWLQPSRWLHHMVNLPLFCVLSLVGIFFVIFYFYVWYLLWSAKRPQPVPAPDDKKVAMATTYVQGEPLELVKATLQKMKSVVYPHDTFVLDESNSEELRFFCEQSGIRHFTRKGIGKYNQLAPPYQEKTKGGNLNAFLDSEGAQYEFVTFLDPDHQPKADFLDRVLGYFRDPTVGFVQAPHIYNNAGDSWIAKGGAEQNYYFVGPIQMGLFGNQCCVVNGSHSTFRLSALRSIGGYGVHNADDILTSLRLHARGWKSVYVPEVLAFGLTPVTWKDYLLQQYRWANSMFELLIHHYPRALLRLRPNQSLGYLMLGVYYFFSINFLILFMLPIISIFFLQAVVNVDLLISLQYFMAFYIAKMAFLIIWSQRFLLRRSERRVWWRGGFLLIGSSPYIFYAFIKAVFRKKLLRTKFVTAKERKWGTESYIRFFLPHLLLLGLGVGILIYSEYNAAVVGAVRGMKLFLLMGSLTFSALIISATKWFRSIINFMKRINARFKK
ncbi:MAG: glycosyltransferase family 2 protein [Candidatus Omnitrophota bacterium]